METLDYQDLMSLPDDWWRRRWVCERLAQWLRGYLVGLWVTFRQQDAKKEEHEVYTGFLLYYKDALLWVTAGHVIDRINAIRSTPDIELVRMRWMDQCNILGAESIPIARVILYSATDIGIDFGAINIDPHAARNLLACDEVKLVTEEDIRVDLDSTHPEGFVVFGYPKEGFQVVTGEHPNGRKWGEITANLFCLLVERMEYQDRYKPAGSLRFGDQSVDRQHWWDIADSFFGRMLPFVDDDVSVDQLQDIDRMSGSPVFSVERNPAGVQVRLVGIQSSWVGGNVRQIRAEPIRKIVSLMDDLAQGNGG